MSLEPPPEPEAPPESGSPGRLPWRPSGVVSLLTDFGTGDVYAGVLKGVLLAHAPGLAIVDLTHEIAAQDVRAAAFQLARAWRWFPAGTVHVAVVDPLVGGARAILAAYDRGHAFLAPDNGLLGPVLSPSAEVVALAIERFSLAPRSRTFHGRDVFAPAAARIAAGLAPWRCGAPLADWRRLELPRPRAGGAGEVLGEVVLVDRFGNLVTNVGPEDLEGAPHEWAAEAGGARIQLRGTYGEVGPNELVALVDSFGSWELAVREGSAARRLAAGPGTAVVFRRLDRTVPPDDFARERAP